jgi:hypothetical protein
LSVEGFDQRGRVENELMSNRKRVNRDSIDENIPGMNIRDNFRGFSVNS